MSKLLVVVILSFIDNVWIKNECYIVSGIYNYLPFRFDKSVEEYYLSVC